MKYIKFLSLAIIFATSNIIAQNPFIETIERNHETAIENKFSDITIIKKTPFIIKKQSEIIARKNNKSYESYQKSINLQKQIFPALNVIKSSRDDVAIITFKVVGNPISPYAGFHMILDADAELPDNSYDYCLNGWNVLYEACEYKIPENASPDLNNPNVLVDGEISIEIPEGVYDFAFLYPREKNIGWATLDINSFSDVINGFVYDFEFKAGLEYIFLADAFLFIKYFSEYDVALTNISLPLPSTELTDEEEITVVITNTSFQIQKVTGDIELTYKINDGDWISPEKITIDLARGEEITYTFSKKADFSESGSYEVCAKVSYELDNWSYNDKIISSTRKPFPISLPFYEDFDTPENLLSRWTIIDSKYGICSLYDRWQIANFEDPDGEYRGCVSNNVTSMCNESAEDYLILDPICIQEADTYNISFFLHLLSGNQVNCNFSLKILYGTSSNPNEFITKNNDRKFTVRHYELITELPFISNFEIKEDRYDWFPQFDGGWEEMLIVNGMTLEEYYVYKAAQEYVPLLSRCIFLQPDIYRFKFRYITPGNSINSPDDFYVTYGLSGTDPLSWAPIEKFFENFANDITENEIIINITESGEYQFAIIPVNLNKDNFFFVFFTIVEIAPEHDFKLIGVKYENFTRITPKYHTDGERKFSSILKNIGATPNESGNIKILLNNYEIYSQEFSFTDWGETINVELNPIFNVLPAGQMNIRLDAEIANGINHYYETAKIVSDSVFAWDYIDMGFIEGIGLNVPGGIGLIYDLKKTDILTSITIGFMNHAPATNKSIILAVYNVNDNFELGNMVFEIKHLRTSGNNLKGITFDVPDTELHPGKYFFEVRQLDGVNIAIAYDKAMDGNFWLYVPRDDYFDKVTDNYGYVHIRPNFGKMGQSDIDELRIKTDFRF